jgi:hypothetical protein
MLFSTEFRKSVVFAPRYKKRGEQSDNLEPLLEAEQVAQILSVDLGYVYSQARLKKFHQ